ncbi:MAG: hypothetical protein IKJ32_04400 [Clostridia bacterium]|nr:hypothetical protein [Clostridia bacterium]
MNERENLNGNEPIETSTDEITTEDVLTGTNLEDVAATIENLSLTDTKKFYNAMSKALDTGIPVDIVIEGQEH